MTRYCCIQARERLERKRLHKEERIQRSDDRFWGVDKAEQQRQAEERDMERQRQREEAEYVLAVLALLVPFVLTACGFDFLLPLCKYFPLAVPFSSFALCAHQARSHQPAGTGTLLAQPCKHQAA